MNIQTSALIAGTNNLPMIIIGKVGPWVLAHVRLTIQNATVGAQINLLLQYRNIPIIVPGPVMASVEEYELAWAHDLSPVPVGTLGPIANAAGLPLLVFDEPVALSINTNDVAWEASNQTIIWSPYTFGGKRGP